MGKIYKFDGVNTIYEYDDNDVNGHSSPDPSINAGLIFCLFWISLLVFGIVSLVISGIFGTPFLANLIGCYVVALIISALIFIITLIRPEPKRTPSEPIDYAHRKVRCHTVLDKDGNTKLVIDSDTTGQVAPKPAPKKPKTKKKS